MNVNHTRRGDLSVELRSPSGIVSHLSVTRKYDDVESGYEDWTFMTVAHWYVFILDLYLPLNKQLIWIIGASHLWANGQ
jgi:hypothetical protein